ncbi:MAG: hypothetical protein RL407_2166 [Bacteroidota bacterium]|jgi:hypothetical protein
MVAREFPDSVSGIFQKITAFAQSLGRVVRVFNSSENFGELGIELENPQKNDHMILVQALRVGACIQLTCSPWYKSWKGTRLDVPNLAPDEAMTFIHGTLLPTIENWYPKDSSSTNKKFSWIKLLNQTKNWIRRIFPYLVSHLWTVGVWVLFFVLILVAHRPESSPTTSTGTSDSIGITSCFCQEMWSKGSKISASAEQIKACTDTYICLGNAKASCILKAERVWEWCEF